MKNYVIYLRKSRADLEAEAYGEGETLARHRAALLATAERLGLAVDGVYSEVVSGETIAARPVMQKLLSEVEQGMWKGVLVMEVERLARGDTIDQGLVAQAFQCSHTKIVTPVKTYDPDNEFDEEYFEFGLFMSRREYKAITRRMQRGRLASVQEGKFVGSIPPYGYLREKLDNGKGYTLSPDPENAEAVKLIFEWFVNGEPLPDGTCRRLGYTGIARKLDSLHFKTVSGKPWSPATIKEILSNPAYIAQIRWKRRAQVKHFQDGELCKERPRAKEGEYIIVGGLHQPIVSQPLFNAAQSLLPQSRESPAPKGKTLKNPLAKLVVCGICGRTMVRRPYAARGYPDTLICPNPACPNISVQLQYVENRLLEMLADWMAGYRLDQAADIQNPEKGVLQKEKGIVRLRRDLEGLHRQQDRLHDLLEQGVYTAAVFQERSGKLSRKISETQAALSDLEKEAAQFKNRQRIKPPPLLENIGVLDLYHLAVTPKKKNELLKVILDKAVYIKTTNGRCKGTQTDDFRLYLYPKLPRCRND